jgi:hypothetical protein
VRSARYVERWRALGRLLPQDVRERVFEPAFADLVRLWLESSGRAGRAPFGLQALGTYARCVPIAVPRVLVRHGRLTRVGHIVVWGGAALVLFVLVVINISETYATYGSP